MLVIRAPDERHATMGDAMGGWPRGLARAVRNLRMTTRALSRRTPVGGERRDPPLQDDIASTAYWRQTEPHAPFPPLPDAGALEVI